MFQCSSASRKFLNPRLEAAFHQALAFQCSSASRKFLNALCLLTPKATIRCFSALQRAENSSILFRNGALVGVQRFSALQRAENSSIFVPDRTRRVRVRVSVLFSEPKIPQCHPKRRRARNRVSFSALQRAENSSIMSFQRSTTATSAFQCSSASRKFLNSTVRNSRKQFGAFQCSSASRKFLNCCDSSS